MKIFARFVRTILLSAPLLKNIFLRHCVTNRNWFMHEGNLSQCQLIAATTYLFENG